ncbi:hypothetical protein L0F63_007501, partial [Massospora cicadina]
NVTHDALYLQGIPATRIDIGGVLGLRGLRETESIVETIIPEVITGDLVVMKTAQWEKRSF